MIVSASRRTDIPALFSDWFYNRVGKGFILLKNPYNPLQVGRVTFTPDKVDGVVFWTKNAEPMLKRIDEIAEFRYYFQYTITPYGKDVERNLPDKKEVIIPAFKQLGVGKAIWRYDPIFINAKYSYEYHLRAFRYIAKELEGYTKKVVISFVNSYRSVDLGPLNIRRLEETQKREIAKQLSRVAQEHGMTLYSCSEELGVPPSKCIDSEMFGVIRPKDKNQREQCGCSASVDIGAYSTCRNGCQYCYANSYGRVIEEHDPYGDVLGAPLTGKETIKQRN